MPPAGRPLMAGALASADTLWREDTGENGDDSTIPFAALGEIARRFAPTIVLSPKDLVVHDGKKLRLLPVDVTLLTDTLRLDVFTAAPYALRDTLDIPLRTITTDSLARLAERFIGYRSEAEHMVELYFDYPGRNPREWWRDYAMRRTGPDSVRWSRPTVYVHPFVDPHGRLVLQYWYLYPFNDFMGNHEGDWEHVNVIPSADLSRVAEAQYYFHHRSTSLPRDGYFPEIVDSTHVVVYNGGRMYHVLDYPIRVLAGERNEGSHGKFPYAGEWENVAGMGAPESIARVGSDSSRVLSHEQFDIVLLPEPTRFDYRRNPELLREWAWFLLPVRWGYPVVPSLGWELSRMDVGNRAPYGPSYHIAWNRIAPGHYYQDYRIKRLHSVRSIIEDVLQPWYYLYAFRTPRFIHDTGRGESRGELAEAGLAPRARARERGVGTSLAGASLSRLGGAIGSEYGQSNGISLWSNLWVKARAGAVEVAGGYQRFPRRAGEGGALFVYPFTLSVAARMPEALFRPYATAGAGLFGWESRLRQEDRSKHVWSGWETGATGSVGVEYYLRTYVALDVALRHHRTRAPSLDGTSESMPLRFTSLYVGHYLRF